MAALLEVKGLEVAYHTHKGPLKALYDVNFEVQHGEIVGIVGESGCGKSTVASALLRLLPPNGEILSGQLLLKGRDLMKIISGRAAPPARPGDRHDLPGPHYQLEPGLYYQHPDAATSRTPTSRPSARAGMWTSNSGRWRSCSRWVSPMLKSVSTPSRTSSRAACASAL